MTNVYIVQREEGGIPDMPEVFASEEKAVKRYIELVEEIAAEDSQVIGFKTEDAAADWMRDNWDEVGVRIWGVEVTA